MVVLGETPHRARMEDKMNLTITMTSRQYNEMVAKARQKKIRIMGQVYRDGEWTKIWMVKSGSERGAFYEVSRDSCGCRAHKFHGYCSHRAWLWHQLQGTHGFTITFGLPNPPYRAELEQERMAA